MSDVQAFIAQVFGPMAAVVGAAMLVSLFSIAVVAALIDLAGRWSSGDTG